ncbi:MAG: tRNA (adenosine(37)-N6)-threonylcarbamoyltransferase complex ATPase subunit type 1 TsaE [Eubacteriales bacterium]
MAEYVSLSPDMTRELGRKFAPTLKRGTVVCLNGQMGAGKTVFVQGCMEGLGYTGPVTSPTFALCNIYDCGGMTVSHYDLYRISGYDDLFSVGFFDDTSDLIFVEWACNADGLIDDPVEISFRYGDKENERILTF